jgi:hypothetical protein
MFYGKRIILPTSSVIRELLPKRLHRQDVSGYLLSKTFERRFGEEFPRREVLVKLAAAAALVTLPVRSAKAASAETYLEVCKGTIECIVAGVELVEEYLKLKEHTSGQADAENKKGQSCSGTIVLGIFDDGDELEVSEGRQFSIPRYTSGTFTFKHGPAPQERGSKTFVVASEIMAATTRFDVS